MRRAPPLDFKSSEEVLQFVAERGGGRGEEGNEGADVVDKVLGGDSVGGVQEGGLLGKRESVHRSLRAKPYRVDGLEEVMPVDVIGTECEEEVGSPRVANIENRCLWAFFQYIAVPLMPVPIW